MSYVRVARVDELPSGSMKKVIANGKELLLANIDGNFYAMDNLCSHMKGDLSEGTLSNNVVTCPKHGSQFDLTNAKCVRGPKIAFVKMKGKDLSAYETKVEGQELLVNL
jgi:3-phenylpropionate/trans-cinnamate dioxygenase ferredoxin subunit